MTGTLLFFPAAGHVLFQTVHESLLMATQIGGAVVIGAALQVVVISSLYFRMDIDWRFRRPRVGV